MSTRWVLIVLVSCALGLAGATVATAGDESSKADRGKVKVFTLKAVTAEGAATQIDLDKDGVFEQGDRFVFNSTLHDGDKAVGTLGVECILTHPSKDAPMALCHGAASFPFGQLTLQALIPAGDEPTKFDVAITGGTGRFKTAHGQVHVKPVDEATESLTFKVIH